MADLVDFAAAAERMVRLMIDERHPLWATLIQNMRQEVVNVWNVRGEADLAKMEDHVIERMGPDLGEPYAKDIARELRKLDR